MTAFSLIVRTAGNRAMSFDWLCDQGAMSAADASGVSVGISGRITNTREMAASLGYPADLPLPSLLRYGWFRWGRELADHLRGSFVVAILDQQKKRLFLARDALGVAPICYTVTDGTLVAADGSRSVRAISGKHYSPDRAQLADFIAGGPGDNVRTYFDDIIRLPPGHWLEFKQGNVTTEPYWTASHAPMLEGNISSFAEQFTELFDVATRNAYSPHETGLLLSGGLDSSMIAGSLYQGLGIGNDVTALSMTYRQTADWHDARHLDALRASLPFSYIDAPSDVHDPLADLERHLLAMDGPWMSYGHSVTSAAMHGLAGAGCKIVLNGHLGDEVVGYGFGRLNELAQKQRWCELWRLAPIAAALRHETRWTVFSYYLDHLRPVRTIRQRWRRLLHRRQAVSGAGLLNSDANQLMREAFGPSPGMPMQQMNHDERMLHEAALSSPLQARAFEVFAHASRVVGVETRMPFADRDLVDFSLGLPSYTKMGGGFSRRILRESLRGRVPDTVRMRNDKFDFGAAFVRGLSAKPERLIEELSRAEVCLVDLVDPESLHHLRNQVLQTGTQLKRQAALDIWRVIVASTWLKIESDCVVAQPGDRLDRALRHKPNGLDH